MPPDPVLRAGNPLASMYFDVRDRFVGTVAMLSAEGLERVVPACPEWTVHELFTHVVSMPMAIAVGDIPEVVMGGGDPNPWLADLVAEHSSRSVVDLARWWASADDALSELFPGAGLLLADLFTHESDLHGALRSQAHRRTPELDSQIDAALAGVQQAIAARSLAPIAVDDGHDRRVSGEGEPGWTLRVDFWEAHRALNSRRTRDELVAIPHDGNPEPYLDVLHDHLPLPQHTLGE